MPIDLSRTIGGGTGDGSSGYSGYSGFGGSRKTITQAGHGLSVGNIVRLDEPTLLYVKAQADSATNAEVVGIVSEVANSNTFTLITQGWLENLSGLNDGAVHFLSATTPGLLVDVDVSTPGHISKPLLIATSATAGYFFNWRGVYLSDPVTGSSGFSGYSGTIGVSGFSGYSGISGFSGYSGPSGFSGYSGLSGFSGYSGPWGGAITIPYRVITTLTDTSPDPGELYFNTIGNQNAATAILLNETDRLGTDWGAVLNTLDDSTSALRGHIRVVKEGDATKWIVCSLTTVTDLGTQSNIAISVVGASSANPFSAADRVLLCFSLTGDSGFSGYSGRSGFSGYSGLSGFSGYSGPSGFSGYSGISGFSGYSGRSGFSGYSGLGTSGFSGYSGPTWAESSPSQITSNQNDYSFTAGTSLLRLSADADGRTITGLAGGVAGKVLFIRNVGTKEIILAHQNTSSSAANRFILPYPVDFVLRPDDTYELIYDDTTDRWIMVGGYDAFLKDERYCSYLFEEFISGSLSTSGTMGSLGWTQTGAGSITRTNIDSSTQGRPGNIYLSSSSGQDKAIYMNFYAPAATDQLIFSCSVRLPTSISDGTNTYHVSFGFAGQIGTTLATLSTLIGGGTPPTFVGFEYDHTVSANWLFTNTSAFNGTGQQNSTGVTASADTWTRFDVVYRPGVPTADYYVNGASVGSQTSATYLPDIANQDSFYYGGFYYYKSAGASARWFHIDYARMLNIRTTKR